MHKALGTAVAVLICAAAAAGGTGVGGNPSPGTTAATGGVAGGAVMDVDEKANNTTVRVPVGARVRLMLHSDYWTVQGSSQPDVLAQDGPTTQLPRTPTNCPPGLGCNPLQTTFTARAPGTAVITASRTTCGEAMRCVGDEGTYKITIVVTA